MGTMRVRRSSASRPERGESRVVTFPAAARTRTRRSPEAARAQRHVDRPRAAWISVVSKDRVVSLADVRDQAGKNAIVGMCLFLTGWAFALVPLLVACMRARLAGAEWARPNPLLAAATTVLAAATGFLVYRSLEGFRLERSQPTRRLAHAACTSALFVGAELLVGLRAWQSGLRPFGSAWGSLVFAVLSLHGALALIAAAGLCSIALRAAWGTRGRTSPDAVRLWAYAWGFVGVLWCAIFIVLPI